MPRNGGISHIRAGLGVRKPATEAGFRPTVSEDDILVSRFLERTARPAWPARMWLGPSSWGLRSPCLQACAPREPRKRQKWQVKKSTIWLTRRQLTKNGNFASGGSSRDRKSSRIYAAIVGRHQISAERSRGSARMAVDHQVSSTQPRAPCQQA